jgi:hypothetical protein
VKLRTLLPLLPTNNTPWQSQTPSNTLEFDLQLTLIRNKYKREQGSSLNSVLSALKHYAKGGVIISHKLVIAIEWIKELKVATRRKLHKIRQI